MSLLQIREAVITLNETFLTPDTTQKLINILPTTEEINAIQSFEGDTHNLGAVETFFASAATVPRLEQRLKCWLASLLFDDNISQIREKIEAISRGTKALKASRGFPKSLEVILAVGNYLNGTSARGGAYGFRYVITITPLTRLLYFPFFLLLAPSSHSLRDHFRLDILGKLNDVKASSSKKGTLLNYIATQIDKIPQCKDLVTELSAVHEAAEHSLSQVENDCKAIQLSLNLIKKELEEMEGQPNDVAKAFKAKVIRCIVSWTAILAYPFSRLCYNLRSIYLHFLR